MSGHTTSIETKKGYLNITFSSEIGKDSEMDVIDIIPNEMLDSTKEHQEFEEYFKGWMEEKIAKYEENKNKFVIGFDKNGKSITTTVSREEYIQRVKEAEATLRQSFETMKKLYEPKKLSSEFSNDLCDEIEIKKNKRLSDLGKDDFENIFKEIIQGMSFKIFDLERENNELKQRMKFFENKNDFREDQIKRWQGKSATSLIVDGTKKLVGLATVK